jgi:hypothetical protein
MHNVLAVIAILLGASIALWDVYASNPRNDSMTVSFSLNAWFRDYPVLPFGMGMLVAHLLKP